MPDAPDFDQPTIDQYPDWFRDKTGVDLTGGATEDLYEILKPNLIASFESSVFWTTLIASLRPWSEQYTLAHKGFPLNATASPALLIKDFDSAINKSYRWNVRDNPKWPLPPLAAENAELDDVDTSDSELWYGPQNWLAKFPDIVRSRIAVVYLDGVVSLTHSIGEVAEHLGVLDYKKFLAGPDGYHAAHLRIIHDFPTIDYESHNPSVIQGLVEIQVTTGVQESIGKLLHSIYETSRIEGPTENWEWDPTSPAFSINYLGPTLHYLEGMIVNARDKVK